MTLRWTVGWMAIALIAACDADVDDDYWEHDAPAYDHTHPPPYPQTPPPSQPWAPPHGSAAPQVVHAPQAGPGTLVPAVAWRTTEEGFVLQQVGALGAFPQAWAAELTGVRPLDSVLTSLSHSTGERFAYGYLVAARTGPTRAGGAACTRLPCSAQRSCPAAGCAYASCATTGCQDNCVADECARSACSRADGDCSSSLAAESAPPFPITGVVEDYLVLYLERGVPAGSLLAGLFNDYAALLPGIHLIRSSALSEQQAVGAALCREEASVRSLARYNARHRCLYEDEYELRAELSLRSSLGDRAAAEQVREYDRLAQEAQVEQRCRFRVLARAVDTSTCSLTVRPGATLPAAFLTL